MGWEGNDPCIGINSSIALLQERFRVLQKEKERREGRQLMNKFLDAPERLTFTATSSPKALQFQPVVKQQRLYFHPDLMFPEKQKQKHPQIFLSLWPSSDICYQEQKRGLLPDKDAAPAPLLKNLWQTPKDTKPSDRLASANNSSLGLNDHCCMDCDSDVDTSLHL